MVLTKIYDEIPISRKEILRYAGCKSESDLPQGFLDECIEAAKGQLSYKVCYSFFDAKINGDICDFGDISVKSAGLAKNLKGCTKAVIFAATIGVGIDRLIQKYGAVSPAKAVILGAFGAERIEALCDRLCVDIKGETKMALKPRFSPGYGDLDLSFQKEIFALLGCEKLIGLTLNSSMMMSPSKSVTAIAGLYCGEAEKENKCGACRKTDCAYRGVL